MLTISRHKVEGSYHLDLGIRGFRRLMIGLLYGDLLQKVYLNTRAYEAEKGSANALLKKWTEEARKDVASTISTFKSNVHKIVEDFAAVKRVNVKKPRVGIVGEILLKYHPQANLQVVEEILAQGAEPQLGDISSFILYCLYDPVYQAQTLDGPKVNAFFSKLTLNYLEHLRAYVNDALRGTVFGTMSTLKELLTHLNGLMSPAQQAGEGWLLTAEMVEFLHTGTPNVLCLQPFACLPNHITGKGVMRALRETVPGANLCAIDFEAGTSHANFSNRLKLFLAQAVDNLNGETPKPV